MEDVKPSVSIEYLRQCLEKCEAEHRQSVENVHRTAGGMAVMNQMIQKAENDAVEALMAKAKAEQNVTTECVEAKDEVAVGNEPLPQVPF